MKTVTCCICGKEITKRKSLAYSDGRACRSHKEVVTMVAKLKAETSENVKKFIGLTDYQVSNWRTVLCRMIGPYAFLMTKDEVNAIKDSMQRHVNNLDKASND